MTQKSVGSEVTAHLVKFSGLLIEACLLISKLQLTTVDRKHTQHKENRICTQLHHVFHQLVPENPAFPLTTDSNQNFWGKSIGGQDTSRKGLSIPTKGQRGKS